MWKWKLIRFLQILILIIEDSNHVTFEESTRYRNILPTFGNLTYLTNQTILDCSRICLTDNNCKSFFYGDSVCYGYGIFMSDKTNFTVAMGMSYYVPKVKSCTQLGYNYNEYPRMCYKLFEPKMTAFDAMEFCLDQGGGLVRMKTQDEIEIIRTAIMNTSIEPKRFWIGLNDMESEGIFRWWDGQIAEVNSWGPGQPDQGSDSGEYHADCVMFGHWNSTSTVNWWDRTCSITHSFICELVLFEH